MKKLLSIILALAMVLGMASVSAFAVKNDTTGPFFVVTGNTVQLPKAPTGATSESWVIADGSDYASVGSTTGIVTGTAVASGVNVSSATVTHKYTASGASEATTETVYVKVVDASKFAATAGSYTDTVSVNATNSTITPVFTYNTSTTLTTGTGTGELADATIEIVATSNNTAIATVNGSTRVVTGVAAGNTSITVDLKIDGTVVKSLTYPITVSGIAITDEIVNGEDFDTEFDTVDEMKAKFADAINSAFSFTGSNAIAASSITSIGVKKNTSLSTSSMTAGYLYMTGGTSANAITNTSTYTQVVTATTGGVEFESKDGCIGKIAYDVEVSVGGTPYYGTWTFDVQADEDIDDEQTATFAREQFYLDIPSEVKYLKIVSTENEAGDYSSLTATKVPYTLDSKKSSVTLYVVGRDSSGIAHSGTIKLTGANADFSYVGEEDKETGVDEKDFINLLDDIADDRDLDDSPYSMDLDSVEFALSNKEYNIYFDGTKMKSSTKDVDVDELDEVTIEPLVSKEVTVDFTLKATRTSSKTSSYSNKYTFKGRLVINAVAGNLKYSVVAGSSVFFDEDDFQDFYEDATDSTKAVLYYIVLDTDDLKTTQGSVQVPYSTKGLYEVIDEDERLYTEAKAGKNDYEIGEAKFVAKKLTNGTKLYIPFTATGNKGSEEGYIEIEYINNPFTDVAKTDYFYDSVLWATAKGITKGTNVAGTLFSPAQGCTRAQVVTFLYRAAGSPSVTTAMKSEVAKFTDVNSTKHKDFIDAIAWAKYYGITSGTSATTFGPDKTCTRAQIVTFIANYVSKVDKKSVTPIYTNQFTDVKPTTTHKSYAAAIQWAVEKGITKGTNAAGTLFSPDATCTRGQVVTFLYNYFK